ncbi:MAG: dihydrofolate reductase [Gammaproteobacteria bacterium]|nr:dihydrofolate reductase [Gammaproteobacteria bacterium]MBV9620434.1 dihydrofolate reductase [Gammaproteobacteria bacterium]
MAAPPRLALVVAAARNGVIGRDNALPWRLPEDLRRFKALTLGKPVLMGRRTFSSIGRALPGRRNLVLTRDPAWSAPDVHVVHSLAAALEQARPAPELLVIGGEEIFRAVLPQAERIYLTRVHADLEGDTFFPALEPAEWREVAHERYAADARHAYPMSFVTLERVGAAH